VWFDYTACLRDIPTPAEPKVHVIDEHALDTRFPPTATSTSQDILHRALALLDLMPTERPTEMALEDRNDSIAAFYAFDDQAIYVVDRGEPLDSETAVSTLAHEFVHAMQDEGHQLRDFLAQRATTFDRRLAALSVVEGEASLYQLMAQFALHNRNIWIDHTDHGDLLAFQAMQETNAPFTRAGLVFPYTVGRRHMLQAWLHGTDEAVRAVFDDPPVSTRQVFADFVPDPAHRSNLDEFSPLVGTSSVSLPAALEAWQQVGAGLQLGGWMVSAFSFRRGVGPGTASWKTDRFVPFVKGDHVAFVWEVRWQDDASEHFTDNFLTSVSATGDGLRERPVLTAVDGRSATGRTILVGASDLDLAPWLDAADRLLAN